jgi:hypothetical protein
VFQPNTRRLAGVDEQECCGGALPVTTMVGHWALGRRAGSRRNGNQQHSRDELSVGAHGRGRSSWGLSTHRELSAVAMTEQRGMCLGALRRWGRCRGPPPRAARGTTARRKTGARSRAPAREQGRAGADAGGWARAREGHQAGEKTRQGRADKHAAARREFGRALIHGKGLRLGAQGRPASSKRRGDRPRTMRLGRTREQDPEQGEDNGTQPASDAGGRTHRPSRVRARAGRGAPRPWRAAAESTAGEGAVMIRKRSARTGKKLHSWARRLEITKVLSGEKNQRERDNVAELPELFRLKCLSPALEVRLHLNGNNPSIPRI